ncbi:DUF6155 family protein [Autumnicola psychrophila]|uniref:DUF6155 family protein n=1 Tax=Autumnicola psychrophila TaxID=3075592 RepID=A0ABU3DPY5_9FLAO|nr:DUF6155 family protein [Zunongwangia sp. F225]MDT0685773.1 DUF6155 family protein [Zunongwangia sp. F225]
MSKRALKKYLGTLEKEQLEEQILDLYERFGEVKTFYNFVFNPKEEKLVQDAKFKISKEYFPTTSRRPKARRSVAQKFIKHFIKLGLDPILLADVMLYNIEVAQAFSADREIKEAFCRSIYKSFEEATTFILTNNLTPEFLPRMHKIEVNTQEQDWPNKFRFEKIMDQFH